MDEKELKVSEQMENVLREKISELSYIDIESENAKEAAETLVKVSDAYAKIKQEERDENDIIQSEMKDRKDVIIKILTIVGGVLGTIGAAAIKCLSDRKIAERNLEYLSYEHSRAYEFEENGRIEHVITSPEAKSALKERPKI